MDFNALLLKVHLYPLMLPVIPFVFLLGMGCFVPSETIDSISLICLFLMVIYALLIVFIDKHIICSYRVSKLFHTVKYPWSRYYFIVQSKRNDVSERSCKELLRNFSRSEASMLHELKPNRTYLASTHSTVIRRLKANPNVRLTEFDDIVMKSLSDNLKNLVQKNCDTCEQLQTCYYYKNAQKERSFRTIQFELIA